MNALLKPTNPLQQHVKISEDDPSSTQSRLRRQAWRCRPHVKMLSIWIVLLFALALAACNEDSPEPPTRTPVPTWTATLSPAEQAAINSQPQGDNQPTQPAPEAVVDTPVPDAAATETPPPASTDTPTPEATPTETPEPTATVSYAFELETAEKFPTESLAPNMVRVNLFVHNAELVGLGGYRL